MLLRFRFSNFGPFRDEQEISFVAGSKEETDNLLTTPAVGEKVLPVAAIYGANASGKTTVIRALHFMVSAILNSHWLWKPAAPIPVPQFRGSTSAGAAKSAFELDFVQGNIRYQYGFEMTRKAVAAEWLFSYPRGRRTALFHRNARRQMRFSRILKGDNKTIARLTRGNSLFLSTAAQNDHEALLPLHQWFDRAFAFVTDDRGIEEAIELLRDDASRALVEEHLRNADVGIGAARLAKSDRSGQVAEFIKVTGLRFEEAPASFPDDRVELLHRFRNRQIPFSLSDESAGTISYLALLGPMIGMMKAGGTVLVDELDRSLHPLMAREIIRIFNSRGRNSNGAQMLFNTHDANLLGSRELRRDQIWFTEKDRHGESHLYPLTDFKPRKEENIENGYLQGRYGAIPFIDSVAL